MTDDDRLKHQFPRIDTATTDWTRASPHGTVVVVDGGGVVLVAVCLRFPHRRFLLSAYLLPNLITGEQGGRFAPNDLLTKIIPWFFSPGVPGLITGEPIRSRRVGRRTIPGKLSGVSAELGRQSFKESIQPVAQANEGYSAEPVACHVGIVPALCARGILPYRWELKVFGEEGKFSLRY